MRREFPDKIKAAIVHRAINADGRIVCEGCGLVLGKRPYHIDHTTPDALAIDKSEPLTAEDGKLLGWECCHKPKTAIDQGNIAKAKRRERKITLGIRQARNVMPGSKASRFKKRMDGTVEVRR